MVTDGADGTDGEDGDDGANGTDGEHGDENAAEDQRVLTRPLMVVIEGVPALSRGCCSKCFACVCILTVHYVGAPNVLIVFAFLMCTTWELRMF